MVTVVNASDALPALGDKSDGLQARLKNKINFIERGPQSLINILR